MSYFQQPFRPEDISIMASNMNEPNLDDADNESVDGNNTCASGEESGEDLDADDDAASLSVADPPRNSVVHVACVREQLADRGLFHRHELRCARHDVRLLLPHGAPYETKVVQSHLDYGGTDFTNVCRCVLDHSDNVHSAL